MNREDFELVNKIVYFDNAATSLKPIVLGQSISNYYNCYSSNVHRGDYDISIKTDQKFEETRDLVREFINAKSRKEIIFTNNTTDAINKVVFGYFKYLKSDDEVVLSASEHASLILPWFMLGVKVKYVQLDENMQITLENLKKVISNKTKVIAFAHVTNVIGDKRPLEEIIKYAHSLNILTIIDGAQSTPHMKIDVQALDVDFYTFSAHKMLGPTGVGIIYGKEELLNNTDPIVFGGGMNSNFDFDNKVTFSSLPSKLEAGTPNIAGVIGFGTAIKYLNKIGMDNINNYVNSLKEYALNRLKEIKNITIYNPNSKSGIITFNYEGVFAQDLAIYLNTKNICIRAGSHCSKMLNEDLNVKNTCRISFYFYNTKEEIDYMINVLKNENLINEII